MPRSLTAALVTVLGGALAACGSVVAAPTPPGPIPTGALPTATMTAGFAASGLPGDGADPQVAGIATEAPAEDRPLTLAFAGDVHAEGDAGRVLAGLGEMSHVLAAADLAVVNLETAVVSGPGTPADKTFVFGAPPEVLTGLAASGVDVVSLANNHGLDHGLAGLADTMAVAAATPAPAVLGIGDTPERAWRPFEATVSGRTVGILAATDVLDDLGWAAVTGPGLASAKGDQEERLVAETAALAARVDVAVVFLHWGTELEVCPTQRQQDLARRLVDAGADVVAGSHAHVVQPVTTLGTATVAYGLGNFVWYHDREPSSITGVLTVTIAPDGSQSTSWQPARVRSGLPVPDGAPVAVPPVTATCA